MCVFVVCSQATPAAGGARRHLSSRSPSPWRIFTGEPSGFESIHWEAPGARRRQKMASPRTVTIVALSFALGLFFVFMGTIKLTPRLSKDAYSEMVSKPPAA